MSDQCDSLSHVSLYYCVHALLITQPILMRNRPAAFERTGVLSCPAVVHNTGNMRVKGVSVQGDTNDCSTDILSPDERMYCTLNRTLTEADFISTTFTVSATGVSGTPHGLKPLQGLSPVIAQLSNPNVSTALLTVSVTANTTVVDRVGDTVMYTITLVGGVCRTYDGRRPCVNVPTDGAWRSFFFAGYQWGRSVLCMPTLIVNNTAVLVVEGAPSLKWGTLPAHILVPHACRQALAS